MPQDSTNYIMGATVAILGNNAGTLVNAGYSFNGWITAPNGNGSVYDAREVYGPASFVMGDAYVALYAVWKDPLVGPWNLTSVNGLSISLASPGFENMTLKVSDQANSWAMSTAPTTGPGVTSSETWVIATTPSKYSFTSASIVTFTAELNGRTLTLTPTTKGLTQVMVFSKQ